MKALSTGLAAKAMEIMLATEANIPPNAWPLISAFMQQEGNLPARPQIPPWNTELTTGKEHQQAVEVFLFLKLFTVDEDCTYECSEIKCQLPCMKNKYRC